MGCHDRRMSILTLCFLAYSGLWVSYLYFNAEITDSTGETVKFRDAVRNFLTSPLWRDLKQNLKNIFQSIWTVGLGETWKQVLISLDPQGEQQALQVGFFLIKTENDLYQLIFCRCLDFQVMQLKKK